MAFSRYKFCLITDVSRFFPSVYTHTIPWAINGKQAAKDDTNLNSATIFGNRLDFIIRQAQNKQTIGIPVGPDTSKIISEVLMASVDAEFLKKSGKTRPIFVRHVDDYWIAGNTHEECEKHLQNIRFALRAHELDINEMKTRIISTKYVFSEAWPYEFENEIIQSFSTFGNRTYDPVSTLSKIIERATHDNDDAIIRHVIRIIDENKLWSANWQLLEHFLAQCAIQFTHSFDYAARVIAYRARTKQPIDQKLWEDVAKLTAQQCGALGRDSEVIWALWLLKELNCKVPKSISDIIVTNNSAIALCFLAHLYTNKLTTDKSMRQKFEGVVEGCPFAGAFWPLTLELNHLGIALPSWKKASATPSLRALHDAGVSMIDWNALPKVFDANHPNKNINDNDDPGHAIEDYGFEYSESDEENDDNDNDEFDIGNTSPDFGI
jgi:hypothetical protein